jgi:DNA-binding transcriptional LysR family regulator
VLADALKAVARHDVDVAIGVFRTIPDAMTATHLFDDEYCVIARQGHPSIRSGHLDKKTYATVGHVFVGNPDAAQSAEPTERAILEETYGSLPGPDVIWTHAYVSHWETAMLIIAQSDALADCPKSLALRHAGRLGLQVVTPPFEPFEFKIHAVHLASQVDRGRDWLIAKLTASISRPERTFGRRQNRDVRRFVGRKTHRSQTR